MALECMFVGAVLYKLGQIESNSHIVSAVGGMHIHENPIRPIHKKHNNGVYATIHERLNMH